MFRSSLIKLVVRRYTLLRRYSQGVLKETVSSAEVLMVSEIIKLVFSGYATIVDTDLTDAQGIVGL